MRRVAASIAAVLVTVILAAALPVYSQRPQTQAKAPPKKAAPAQDPLQQLLAQAEESLEKENFADAAKQFEAYLAQRPDDSRAHFQLGYAYTALRDAEKAKTHYQRAVELDPKLAAGYQNLGIILLEQNAREAIAPLQKAVELLPGQARPRFLLGMALEQSERPDEALKSYTEAEQLDPRDFEVEWAMGRVLLTKKDYPDAEKHFRAALDLKSDTVPARLGLAESLLAQDKIDSATTEFLTYLAAKPDDFGVRLKVASLCVDQNKFQQALAELEKLEGAKQSLPQVYRLRAVIHQKQNRLTDAAQDLEKAVALEPRDWELHAIRGRVLLELRDFPAAEREFHATLQLKPDEVETLRNLVSTLYLAENYPGALQALEQLGRQETLSAGSWFVRATCYDKLHMPVEALAAYRKFVELDQGKSEKQDFQARQRIKAITLMLEKKK